MGEYDETVDIAEQLALMAKHGLDERYAFFEMARWIRARERGLHKIIGGLVLQTFKCKSLGDLHTMHSYEDDRPTGLVQILDTAYMAKVAPDVKIEGSPSALRITVRVYP